MSPLPSQNQLYAYYIARCGHHRVGKPNRNVLHLLREDEASRVVRLNTEAADRQVTIKDLKSIEREEEDLDGLFKSVPLARRRKFRLPTEEEGELVHLGARGMLALLDLLALLPKVREIDLSNISSWYIDDAFAATGTPTGNDIVARLCEVAYVLPSLRRIDLSSQPIGTLAAHQILLVIQKCKRLTEVHWKRDGVDNRVSLHMEKALLRNAACTPEELPPVMYAEELPSCLTTLPILDRKTLREQQILRGLLAEDCNFSEVLSEEDLSALVLHARLMSTQEAIARCGENGLRGDGENLFVMKTGAIRAYMNLNGFQLHRGDYFGDTYSADMLYPACRLVEEERGVVYCFPLDCCAKLTNAWAERVALLFPVLRKVPLLQPLDLWSRIRVCTCSVAAEMQPEQVVVASGDSSRCLWIVLEGSFSALAGSDDHKVLTGRYDPFVFSTMDVFGIEAQVSRRHNSSVTIVADKGSSTRYRCAVVSGAVIRLLVEQLHSVFVSMSRPYSVHEDLRQTARKAVEEDEWSYCI